ncbi:hypothetical protein [Bradyrhizobium retamae]|uniref:hypothetical protein n=1 Tax=Bradyrhizobium retamae TaxID=1300035 RepID=UPI001AEC923D|nr:hypothetical protein [Bradyrhizobium retamae]
MMRELQLDDTAIPCLVVLDVGPDLLLVGARAIVLAAIRSILSFGIAEVRRKRLFSRYQQKCQQSGRLR